MAEEPQLIPLVVLSEGGVKRDGTTFDSPFYVDSKWTRYDRNRPRKMGGYRMANRFLYPQPYALSEFTRDNLTYLHFGSGARLERLHLDKLYNTSIVTDRTPTVGFTASDDNLWQFAVATDVDGLRLVAQVAPNLGDITNSAGGQLFVGDLTDTAVLTAVPALSLPGTYSLSGGVVSLHPYTVVYGSDGFVMWSVDGDPTDYVGSGAGSAYVTRQKIVKGLPMRAGPANSPAGLLWSVDTLVSMSYVGGTAVFAFNEVSTDISVLSPNSIVEYDGIYYWVGSDRFFMFNGVVRDIPNEFNADFFFDNINDEHKMKTFAIKVPRFGEIWWCFPKGESTEPNHAIIFNTRDGKWYDTELPGDGRSCGVFMQVLRKPLMVGVDAQAYRLDAVATSAIGSGYTVGDNLLIDGGSFSVQAQIVVDTVDGSGGITGVTIVQAGTYSEPPTGTITATGGTGVDATFTTDFVAPRKLWVHEVGVNEADGLNEMPIKAYFETGDIGAAVRNQYGTAVRCEYLIPDIAQTGDMTVQVAGRANPRAPDVLGEVRTFGATAANKEEELVYVKEQRRELRFRFESDIINGDFNAGQSLAYCGPGDGRMG